MLLGCRFLLDVATVNSFEVSTQVEIAEGDNQTVYFQLVDTSVDRADQGFSPSGRRYIPADGSTLSVDFGNVDDAKKITRSATNPFAGDKSIWSVPVLGTDPLKGTVSLTLTLTEPTRVLHAKFMAGAVLRVR